MNSKVISILLSFFLVQFGTGKSWGCERHLDAGGAIDIMYGKHISYLPPEVLSLVFKEIPLPEMPRITLTCKNWNEIARQSWTIEGKQEDGAFADFNRFMTKYKDCSALLAQDPSLQNTCLVMDTLRQAQATLALGRSEAELRKIAENYAKKALGITYGFCLRSRVIKLMMPDYEKIVGYPIPSDNRDLLIYLAMSRIYFSDFNIGKDDYLSELKKKKNIFDPQTDPSFLIVGPNQRLQEQIIDNNNTDENKYTYAFEYCQRTDSNLIFLIHNGNRARDASKWNLAALFYSTALKKNPNLSAITYADTGTAYGNLKDWEKAAHYLSKAIEKDLTPTGFMHLNYGYASAKLGDTNNASFFFQKAIDDFIGQFNDPPLKLLPDTLTIMENILKETKAERRYLEWVQKQRVLQHTDR